MTRTRRLLLAVLTCLALGTTMLASTPAQAAKPQAKINSVGDRFPGSSVPIVGYLSGTGTRNDKTLKLQHQVSGSWKSAGKLKKQDDGQFKFPSQKVDAVGVAKWRVVVKSHGSTLTTSKTLSVHVIAQTCASQPGPTTCPQPAAFTETQDVDGVPQCNPAGGGTVVVAHQTRQTPYVWNPTALGWVLGTPGPWATTSTSTRPATASECPAAGVTPILPDLIVRALNTCPDSEDTDPDPNVDNCFRIVHIDAGGIDRKLLKFPVVTSNQGPGDLRIEATRSTSTSTDWQAKQVVQISDGTTSFNFIPSMEFFFATDGHSHWHIRDFDDYSLRNADGTLVSVGEKHGYCLEDNTTLPGVTTDPVYTHDTVCGVGNPDATSILHGLSVGWGDTYPSSLPDQAIDVTGLPDGVYTVRVAADGLGLVRESNNANNAQTQQVSIVGDTVTPVG